MKRKNSILAMGIAGIISVSLYGNEEIQVRSQTEENVSHSEVLKNEIDKEVNDDIFVQFIDGDVVEKPSENKETYERYDISNKIKGYKGNYIAFEIDKYGIIANNIDKLD